MNEWAVTFSTGIYPSKFFLTSKPWSKWSSTNSNEFPSNKTRLLLFDGQLQLWQQLKSHYHCAYYARRSGAWTTGQENRRIGAFPCPWVTGHERKQQLVTWLNQSNIEDLLNKAVVRRDLIDGTRSVLYADYVNWNQIVRHSTPEHSSMLFAYLEYFRPQPVSSATVTLRQYNAVLGHLRC